MDENATLIDALVARMKAADDAMHSGDTGPRRVLWSTSEPVTVFGAARSATGPVETDALFDWVASPVHELRVGGVGDPLGGRERRSRIRGGDRAHHRGPSAVHRPSAIRCEPPPSCAGNTANRRAFHRHADPVQGSQFVRDRLLAGAESRA